MKFFLGVALVLAISVRGADILNAGGGPRQPDIDALERFLLAWIHQQATARDYLTSGTIPVRVGAELDTYDAQAWPSSIEFKPVRFNTLHVGSGGDIHADCVEVRTPVFGGESPGFRTMAADVRNGKIFSLTFRRRLRC